MGWVPSICDNEETNFMSLDILFQGDGPITGELNYKYIYDNVIVLLHPIKTLDFFYQNQLMNLCVNFLLFHLVF